MRMMGHGRAPAVQYRGDADAGSEVLRVGRDGEHRLRRGLEQQIVDHGLVLVGDVANRRRQREDDVEVGNREQLGLARRHPLACCRALALRAVPVAAAVVGDRSVGAVLAARDVSAEGRRAFGNNGNTAASIAMTASRFAVLFYEWKPTSKASSSLKG